MTTFTDGGTDDYTINFVEQEMRNDRLLPESFKNTKYPSPKKKQDHFCKKKKVT